MKENTHSAISNPKSKISKPQSLRVLIVEDSEDDALLIIRELKKGGYNPVYERVETAATMKKALNEREWDITLCDYKLPKFNAPSAIAVLRKKNIDIPLIIVSGAIGEETAIECMRQGAHDYIMKDNLSRLCPAVARELEEANSRSKRKQAEQTLKESESRFRNIFESSKDGIIFFNGKTQKIILGNATMAELLGCAEEDLLGRSISSLHPSEEWKSVEQEFQKHVSGKTSLSTEIPVRRNDGSVFYADISSSLMTLEGETYFSAFFRDITERKRTEEALRESEANFRRSLDNSPLGVRIVTAEGETLYVNQAAMDMYGFASIEELRGTPLKKRYTPESYADFKIRREKRDRGQHGPTEYEIDIVRKNGEIRHLHVFRKEVIWNGEKQFQVIFQDITKRKLAEEALRESEEKYRLTFASTSDVIFTLDLEFKVSDITPSVEKILGYKPEELINKSFPDLNLMTPESLERAIPNVGRVLSGVEVPNVVYNFITKEGLTRIGEVTGSPIVREGKIIGVSCMARDITERVRAEEKLLQSEEKYRSIVENAQEGIYQSTPEGRYLTLNYAFAKMLGYESPEEVIAAITDIPHQLYVNSEDRKKLLQLVEKQGPVKGYETEFYRKDGSKIWVSINMHAVRDDQGRLLYYQGIDEDITEKKKMETERQENIARLRKSLGATINAMAVTVETRDPYTAGHQRRVADLARAIAMEMNLENEQIDGIRMAGMIHDIGKISIPSEILTKPTVLSSLEFNLIKTHPQSGYNILKDIDFPWPIARIVLEHHERINGSGYPDGLEGEQILLESRILAIADVVEAISSHRPYRPARGLDEALAEISNKKGILYEPDIVNACLRLFHEKNYKMAA